MSPMAGRGRPRADAEQNRQRIIEAARRALAHRSDATLQAIAREAGVGQGTLYRHFPTREALLVTVYRTDLHELLDAADALLRSDPPITALRRWLDRLARYGRIKHGAAEAVRATTRADLSEEYYAQTVAVIDTLLTAGQKAGQIRADVEAEEVLLLVGFLWRVPNENWQTRTAHLLDLVLDGLRTGR